MFKDYYCLLIFKFILLKFSFNNFPINNLIKFIFMSIKIIKFLISSNLINYLTK